MADLLLELFSEEIPAGMQGRAAEDLERRVTDALKAARLDHDGSEVLYGPRRIALSVTGLPAAQPDLTEEKKGPKVGAPEQAIQGFLKANGLSSVDEAEIRTLDKGDFYFAVQDIKGRPTADVLKEIIESVLPQVAWPKSMRWGSRPERWVRPLHSLLCILDGAVIPAEFAGLTAGDVTYGHRFMAPGQIKVSDLTSYVESLEKAHVIASSAKRAEVIQAGAEAAAKSAGLVLRPDPGLTDEVAGLVEWPVVLTGSIDDEFMAVPPEVLVSAMRKHQRYFALETAAGELAAKLVVVANMIVADPSVIEKGNERVLRARLADAQFFWDQDRKQSLESRIPALQGRIFQADLGTDHQRMERIEALSEYLSASVDGAEAGPAKTAARLCKADLTTGMVGEFPDLQGIMGRYYARHDGVDEAVADAIADHYKPAGPSDTVPSAPLSIVVALADKIDTLTGFFSIDQKPTGSKDPFALRRAAIGVIRIILDNGLRLNLRDVFATALESHGVSKGDQTALIDDLMAFFADRLKVHLRDQGVRHDLISAVFALNEDDLVRVADRAEALSGFLGTDDGANLLTAYRRAANIVRIEEKNDKTSYQDDLSSDTGLDGEDQALYTAVQSTEQKAKAALDAEDDQAAMAALAELRKPLDIFFDTVTVNAEDPALRQARLRLLARIGRAVEAVADFAKIEG